MLFSAGAAHNLVVTTRYELVAWGDNGEGQLGDGTTEDRLRPELILSGGVQAVAAGRHHSLALTEDGELMAWGCNEDGLLGVGVARRQLTPGRLIAEDGGRLRGIRSMAAGWKHSLALTEQGEVLSWGANDYGQLGSGSSEPRRTPGRVQLRGRARAVAAGWYHSVALLESGEVWTWGFNTPSESSFRPLASPTLVIPSGIESVAAGGCHTVALSQAGDVLVWGGNDHGQLGDGTRATRIAPAVAAKDVARVAAGSYHCVAVTRTDELLLMWGFGAPNGGLVPEVVEMSPEPAYAVAAGGLHSLAVTASGELFAWGGNASGQIGDGEREDVAAPRSILNHGTVPVITQAERVEAVLAARPDTVENVEAPTSPKRVARSADGGGAAASAAGPPAGSEIPHVLLRMTGRPDRSQWQVTQPAAPPPPPARATLGPRRPR